MARTPSLSHLGTAHQIWDSRKVGDQWGWQAGRLGIEDGGTGLAENDAAGLTLPAKPDVVGYAAEAFSHLEEVLSELDDSLLPQVFPGALLFPTHARQGTYGDNLVLWMNHGYEHLGTMEALKGLSGLRGGVTG